MKRKLENIEVAVRARPLNLYEVDGGEESAWDINQAFGSTMRFHKQRQNSRDPDRDQQTDGLDKIIQLKNKYRFGIEVKSKRAGARNAQSRY